MRVTYVTRSFLDYHVPVLEALNEKLNNKFFIIYSGDYIPERVKLRVKNALGTNAIGLTGEKRIGPNTVPAVANSTFRVVYQPGLLAEIAKTRPDVVIGSGFFQWTVFALLYKFRYKIPLVVCYERTFHTERNAQWIRKAYRRVMLRYIDAMAVNGQLSVEYSRWLGMPESKITTGQMAADVDNLIRNSAAVMEQERHALRQRWGNPDLVFLAIGKVIEAKGVGQLLRGWELLGRNMPGRRALVFVGAGADENRFRQLAKELKTEDVFFEGAIDYNALPKYYVSADVFVMPTLEDNWSLVVPEAMACGLPVLCSCYNGCYPELVEEGGNGWVFDPLDERDTFRALKKSVENRSSLKDMGLTSRKIVSSHRPENAADAILKACEIAYRCYH